MKNMQQYDKVLFLKIASISAFATAFTTFLLWLLPKLYQIPIIFEDRVQLHENGYYISRLWVNFIHIPLALMGYFGMAVILRKREPFKVGFGMIWFCIWGLVEMLGVSILIFSVNRTWRAGYSIADAAQKNILKSNIENFYSIWDSMFFVLLIAFLLATIFFSWATYRGKGIEKRLSYLLILAIPLSVLIIMGEYFGFDWANTIVDYTYPVLQPVSRCMLGYYLWKSYKNEI